MEIYNKIFDWYYTSRSPDAGIEVIKSFTQKLSPNSSIFDIGCGYGAPITKHLIENSFKPYSIDSSIKMVTKFKELFPKLPVQHSDVFESNFFNQSFDAAIAYGLIFHLPQNKQEKLIEKVSKHLKYNGYFLFNSGDEDAGIMTSAEFNGGEKFMTYSMSRYNYEKILNKNDMTLISYNIEKDFGSTIYIAKKLANIKQDLLVT